MHSLFISNLKISHLFHSVLGQFVPESRSDKDARNHAIALYKHTTIKCPTHSHTHPSIIEWGSVPSADNPRARITRIPISNRVFYGNDGSLHFANVIPEDLALINNDYRGIQCLLSVGLGTRASNRFKLRQDDNFGMYLESPPFYTFIEEWRVPSYDWILKLFYWICNPVYLLTRDIRELD